MSESKQQATAPEIYQELTAIFRDILDDPELTLRPELTAADVYGWDSLTHVRLVLAVEKAFQVNFSASEVARLKNVGEFVDLILSKLQSNAQRGRG
jgi:acyl carrier protein